MIRANSGVKAGGFRSWFDSGEHADVRLRVRLEGEQRAGQDAQDVRTYPAHAVVLAANSEWFRTAFSARWQQQHQQQPQQQQQQQMTISDRSELTVTAHVQADEVEAMDLLLRLIYGHEPPTATTSTAVTLLRCLRLADRFDVPTCHDALLKHITAAANDAPVLSLVCSILPEAASDPVYRPLFNTCLSVVKGALKQPDAVDADLVDASGRFVIAAYGNVPAVMKSEQLMQEFCSMSFAAVLAWAKSDELQVQSENCVVYLLSAWVKTAQGEGGLGGQGVSSEQLQQLAQQVRVLHLGPAYQHHILPQLAWFKACDSMAHLPLLLAHKGRDVSGTGKAVFPAPDYDCTHDWWQWQGPKQWLAAPRKPRSLVAPQDTNCFRWEVGGEQLQQLYDGAPVRSPPFYCGGFQLQLEADVQTTPGSAAVTLGISYHIVPDQLAGAVRWSPAVAALAVGPVALQVVRASDVPSRDDEIAAAVTGSAYGIRDALGKSAPTMTELLAPYLQDSKLHLQAWFRSVDRL